MRAAAPAPPLPRAGALGGAPSTDGLFFIVPPVIE
jgi:hypothetical protein